MSNNRRPAPLSAVLESVLYFSSENETEDFYSNTLGLKLIAHEPGRHLFYRLGPGMLLLFNPEATAETGSVPGHGASGPGHICLVVPENDYRGWRDYLQAQGVSIIQDADWPPEAPPEHVRGSSFYFRDPSGNLLEIANRDFWPS